MDLGNIMNMANAAKDLKFSKEQKETVKKVVKGASGNKKEIAAELNKHGIKVKADQIDMITKLVDKL